MQIMPCPKPQPCFASMLPSVLLCLKDMAPECSQNAAAAKKPEASEQRTPFCALSRDYREANAAWASAALPPPPIPPTTSRAGHEMANSAFLFWDGFPQLSSQAVTQDVDFTADSVKFRAGFVPECLHTFGNCFTSKPVLVFLPC